MQDGKIVQTDLDILSIHEKEAVGHGVQSPSAR